METMELVSEKSVTDYTVHQTTDYSVFKNVLGNRDAQDEKKIQEIIKSFRINGVRKTTVLVNEKMEIIDGQHRIEALRRLGWPVAYIIDEGATVNDVIALNIHQNGWTMQDFLKSWADRGVLDYQQLINLQAKFPKQTFSVVQSFASQKIGGGRDTKAFKEGKFRVRDLRKTEKDLKFLESLAECGAHEHFTKRSFASALLPMLRLENFDYERLLHKMRQKSRDLIGCTTTKHYKDALVEIYNHNVRSKTEKLRRDEI